MFKKIFILLSFVISLVALTGCGEDPQTDGEYIREIRDTVSFESVELEENLVIPELDYEGVEITWTASHPDYLDIDGTVVRPHYLFGDKIVTLTLTIILNDDVVNKVFEFTVLAEPTPDTITLNTDYTDNLSMDFAYANQSFLNDGVGVVDLERCVDGDTAIFSEGNSTFTVRFLGINTPESTARYEPWGKAASQFTCDKLENATQIVLQSDPASTTLDNYGRHLAWVWYDGRLLNLELVEQAYSQARVSSELLYADEIILSNLIVQLTNKRVWGETDPDFDYSLEGIQVSIEELVKNSAEYEAEKVSVQGIITANIGGAVFIQQGDYGIFLYYNKWSPSLSVGNEIVLSGLNLTYYPDKETGAVQLTNYDPDNVEVVSTLNTVNPAVSTIGGLTSDNLGSLIKLEDVTVSSIYTGDGSFTLTVTDNQGNSISVRKDSDVYVNLDSSVFKVGDIITVVGNLSKYQGSYQVMINVISSFEVIDINDELLDRYIKLKTMVIESKELLGNGDIQLVTLQDSNSITVIIPSELGYAIDDELLTVGNALLVLGQIEKLEQGYKINSFYIE